MAKGTSEHDTDAYDPLAGFFLCFLIGGYENLTDGEVVAKCVSEQDADVIRAVLKKGRELLSLDPFPWEWVYSLVEYRSLDYVEGGALSNKYFHWVAWMMSELELEAKRQGKL